MSTIQRAYKTELDLNDQQVTACRKHAGAARWAYNWGLQRKQDAYRATGKSQSAMDLHRELNALKQTDVPWMYEVSKCAPQEALRNLDTAFAHFLRRAQLKKVGKYRGKLGYPKRKSKKRGLGGFRLTGSITVFPDAVHLPRLGRLRLKEHGYLPMGAVKALSATVTEQAGHWYVSVLVEHQQPEPPANTGPVVGVDLGLKRLATLSDGATEENPRHLKQRLRKIKRLHRAVTRKQKGSHNRQKAARCLGAQYRKVANQRANTLHQLTSRLAKTKSVVVMEDLHVSGLLKNHHLAQAIGDVGFGEFRRQLAYKAAWYGCRVIVADRWFASSKTCSGCGWVDEALTLADRTFRCQACGTVMDRDLNAAKNLEKLAARSADSQNACGGESAGRGREALVKLSPMKQEPNTLYPPAGYNGKFWRTVGMERRGLTPYQRLWRLWVRIRPLGRNSALRPGASRARFYGFTRRAKQVLSLAQEEAQRREQTDIRPEHLLLGMLRERKGMGTQALRELGVDLDTLRSRLNALAGQPLGAPEHDGEIGLTQASKRVIELAVNEGRALSHPYVGIEHILLGLLAEGESADAQALAEMGVTRERAREAVLDVLRRRPDYGVRNEWL